MWLCFASAAMSTQYSLQMPTETCRYCTTLFLAPNMPSKASLSAASYSQAA